MSFRVIGLEPEPFAPLFGMDEAALAARGVRRVRVEAKPGAPCRISLEDAEPGEAVLLLNYEHQPADTPYRSRHAIFVREGVAQARPAPGVTPEALRLRPLSVRAFDADHLMTDADLVDGAEAGALFERLLGDPQVAYLHAHYARRGCFAARVERSSPA
jgi:hypothetical protein